MEYCLDSELMFLEVEKYPYLYDSRHNHFKNRELKKDAWMAVTKNVIGEKWDQMDEKTRSNVAGQFELNCRHVNTAGRIDAPAKCELHSAVRFLQAEGWFVENDRCSCFLSDFTTTAL
ncbi:hypothetical protein AVEN_14566-1 [Araneus ventricosus]|uniref:MADF domain-containing protein n=1 Tax=Araneus ventricosus TaxID=182803 RepID=A0A4Y2CH39_ARAVE|nr:hypothetical protein AVEN_14566-1 [Araneus ventricosus]